MTEENGEKKEVLRTIVLLLIGFVVGFASHAYVSVTGTEDEQIADADDLVELNDAVASSTSTTDEDTTMDGATAMEEDLSFNATPNNMASGAYSISVTDQAAGGVVYVTQMDLGESAWVAVREDAEGSLGNILGAAWYPEGKHSGVVELLRSTDQNTMYYVVLYQDDGDKAFDYKKDTLVTDSDTNVLVTKFRTY
jgi:hypothetical protein